MISETDIDVALPILVARSFGQLVVSTAGAPVGVHMPFFVERIGRDRLRIELHLARMNPILNNIGAGCDVLLMCEGCDAYISPDWYGTENRVPTWAYETVHLTGRAVILPAENNLDHVDRLSAFFEQRLLPKKPWASGKMDQAKRAALLKAITVVSIEVGSIVTKKKDLREKRDGERRGAIDGLRESGDQRNGEIARLIGQTLS